VRRHLRDGAASLFQIVALRWRRAQLRMVEAGFAVALGLLALFAAVALTVAAAIRLVAGVEHGITRATGEEWIGEIGAGVLTLALLLVTVRLARRRARRGVLARVADVEVHADRK
jgi:hypothetical protein